jgi:hypothetical protein
MRKQVLELLNRQSLNGLRISRELPYSDSGTDLFLKNPKHIYVDEMVVETEPLIIALNGLSINNEIASVSVFFTTDAKNDISERSTVIQKLRSIKDSIEYPGATRRESLVNTSYQGDLLLTEIQYRLTRLN